VERLNVLEYLLGGGMDDAGCEFVVDDPQVHADGDVELHYPVAPVVPAQRVEHAHEGSAGVQQVYQLEHPDLLLFCVLLAGFAALEKDPLLQVLLVGPDELV
jgi:hypothetical protein